jgi:hypothetical protein
MSLREQINTDLIAAMKAKESVKVSVLRMLKSAIGAFEVSGKEKVEATPEDVMTILKREVKKRKESIRQFKEGGRDDLAEKEQAELVILDVYMPEMMGEEQVRAVVEKVVNDMGATGPSDMGKVMGASMGALKGQADGGMVKQVVQSVLSSLSVMMLLFTVGCAGVGEPSDVTTDAGLQQLNEVGETIRGGEFLPDDQIRLFEEATMSPDEVRDALNSAL